MGISRRSGQRAAQAAWIVASLLLALPTLEMATDWMETPGRLLPSAPIAALASPGAAAVNVRVTLPPLERAPLAET